MSFLPYTPPGLDEDIDARDARRIAEQRAREQQEYERLQQAMTSSSSLVSSASTSTSTATAVAPLAGPPSYAIEAVDAYFKSHDNIFAEREDGVREQEAALRAAQTVPRPSTPDIMLQQRLHPLGLLAGSDARVGVPYPPALPWSAPAPAPAKSPPSFYSASPSSFPPPPAPDGDAPPPYAGVGDCGAAQDLFAEKPPISCAMLQWEREAEPPRCAHCFASIAPDASAGLSGQGCVYNASNYHIECFEQKVGPHCHHCSLTLTSHPEQGLSGAWGVSGMHRYHVECFQRAAGPRCAECFDVIFADAARGLSGQWRRISSRLFHEECARKLYPRLTSFPLPPAPGPQQVKNSKR